VTNDDANGHGTHVAGTIGATGALANGVTGVAWNVQLVPMQVANDQGTWPLDTVTDAITWAINNNIDIINYSGGGITDNPQRRNAIGNYQGLFVCAAGNDGRDNDTTHYYPSDYSRGQTFSNRVISVGAINNVGNRAGFSNFGSASVSIFAPGQDILSTYPEAFCTGRTRVTRWGTFLECETEWSTRFLPAGEWIPNGRTHSANGYHEMSGTSMATPMVTGTAAIMWSVYENSNSNWTRAQIAASIKTLILSNAITDDTGTPLNNLCVSDGRLNAFRAVSAVAFTTEPTTGGMSITGLRPGFTLANNTNLVLPDRFDPGTIGVTSVNSIGNSSFANQTQLSQITIPNSITNIDSSAFENCNNLTNVTLPNSLVTIESYAFNGCSNLSSIIIPSSVTQIGYRAFQNCSNLTIYITGMTCVPNGWNYYWNPSNRPIYFNGILHTHNNDGREFTGNHYHGIKKNHHYEYRYYCTQCKFTFGTDYEIEICSGPPCPTLYSLPYLSDIDHFEGDSHHDELLSSLHNQIVIYLPTKKENIMELDYL